MEEGTCVSLQDGVTRCLGSHCHLTAPTTWPHSFPLGWWEEAWWRARTLTIMRPGPSHGVLMWHRDTICNLCLGFVPNLEYRADTVGILWTISRVNEGNILLFIINLSSHTQVYSNEVTLEEVGVAWWTNHVIRRLEFWTLRGVEERCGDWVSRFQSMIANHTYTVEPL